MNKKIWILLWLWFVVVGLSACWPKPADMTYDEAYTTFIQSFQFKKQDLVTILSNDFVQENIDLNLVWIEDDVDINVDINSNWITDMQNMNMDVDTKLDLKIKDLSQQWTTTVSITNSLKKIWERMFINIQDFLLDAGPGNTEWQLLGLMVKQFENIWVELDYQDLFNPQTLKATELLKYLKNTETISTSFQENELFVNLWKTEYEGKIAYRITQNNESLAKIIKQFISLDIFDTEIQLENIQFDGLLVIEDHNTVSLLIQSLVIDGDENYTLWWKISLTDGELEIVNPLLEKTINFERKQRRDNIILSLKIVDYKQNPISLDLKLSPKDIEWGMSCEVEGILSMDIPQITTEQTLKDVVFNIKGLYNISKTWTIEIKIPNEYSVLSQMLADDYGISSMIMWTGNDASYVDMTLSGAILND